MSFNELTPEQRAEALAKAQQARADKAAFNKANEHKYKLDYADANHWATLASKHKVRMPAYNEPCTRKGMRKMLGKVGVSNEVWKDHYTSIDYFIEHNPKWTLMAATGLMLEIKEGM